MNITPVLQIAQLLLACFNLAVLIYAFFKFINKPRNDLETRVVALELEVAEQKKSLLQGNDRFRDQEDTNEVMQLCMLALIDFELAFCTSQNYKNTEDLEKAKNALRNHLAKH